MNMQDLLTNSHLNTILPVYLSNSIMPSYQRVRVDTDDGDFIDFDWVNINHTDVPTVVLFHGTEGNSSSHYARRLMYYIETIGWRGVVAHFRGCSGEINRNLKFYHAGETEDIKWILNYIRRDNPNPIYACGVSIGGNMLLKYLGEMGGDSNIDMACAISTPFDLEECSKAVNNGFNKYVYVKHFLNTLLPKMKLYAEKFQSFNYIDKKIDTLDEFNNIYITQITNYQDTFEYYEKCSCRYFLKDIVTPTLILQAQNDPIIPISAWPTEDELSPNIRFVATKSGGHAGFLPKTTIKNYKEALLKMPKFIIDYFKKVNNNVFDESDEVS
jgi:predicted alpha/beta-fold hydrolase